ncbi:MAG: hypothetical protein WA755_02045 [Candidatus Acidiferrales bacterium]
MSKKITEEQVRQGVQRFWDLLLTKSGDQLAEYYSGHSNMFMMRSTRNEPGRLGSAFRAREYFHPSCQMSLDLGPIEVTLLGDKAAVASHTFRFEATNRSAPAGKDGVTTEVIQNGRATHVFVLGADGKLSIVHEHVSAAVGA